MYYLNKIVGWALSPFGILFLGLAASWLVGKFSKLLGRTSLAITLVLVWTLGCGVTTRFIGVPLEGEETPEVGTLEVGGYDAIVLLGGGMGAHEKCGRAEMFAGADRVWHAAKLWKAYHAEGDGMILTISGGGAKRSTIPLLKDLGVENSVIVDFEEARNTEEEAKLIYERIATCGSCNHVPRIMLVTSAWHMPRSVMLFERVGFEVVPKPTDYEMHYAAEGELKLGDFFPSADAAMRNSYALKEWVARLGYSLLRK